eukprot:g28913.t1
MSFCCSQTSMCGPSQRLRVSYALICLLCAQMVLWVILLPGSCRSLWQPSHREFLLSAPEYLEMVNMPSSFFLKYDANPLICFAHVLPTVIWVTILPFQLLPASRVKYTKLHRLAGRVFIFISTLLMVGYSLIRIWRLDYLHDFASTLKLSDATSAFFPSYDPYKLLDFVAVCFFSSAVMAWYKIAIVKSKTAHRRWIMRHVALGLWVAVQRIFFPILVKINEYLPHLSLRDMQLKAAFGDAAVLAIISSILLCEVLIRDIQTMEEKADKQILQVRNTENLRRGVFGNKSKRRGSEFGLKGMFGYILNQLKSAGA